MREEDSGQEFVSGGNFPFFGEPAGVFIKTIWSEC